MNYIIKKNILDLNYNKHLQYLNVCIVLLFTYLIGILIGDVSGKGPAAALLTGFIIGEVKGLLENQAASSNSILMSESLSNSILARLSH